MKDICHSNAVRPDGIREGQDERLRREGPGSPLLLLPEKQIPNYWQYARNFVLADHLFSTTLGPSTPGHAVFWTGQSMVLDNAKVREGRRRVQGLRRE